ncbi:MAG: DUF2339 domain-containing protein [Verrucomicrobia bacterium]|nr:DUF2339 domain-containing protein [Verrucomicrobiota bacterium]
MGVKLFAWLGGLVLFLGLAFAIKYSFDQGWISKELRVAAGYLVGIGLVVGGARIPRVRYALTVQALTSAGILTLYAVTFAASSPKIYNLLPAVLAFPLMIAITATAFVLAVTLDAPAVAVLALLGGFLTPPLLATGEDHPFGLFSYVAMLDIGLIAVALRKRWNHLALLGAIGTMVMEFGWVMKFFEVAKFDTALVIFFVFVALFTMDFAAAVKRDRDDTSTWAAVLVPCAAAFMFAFGLVVDGKRELIEQPGKLFSFAFLVDVALLAVVWLRDRLRAAQFIGGIAVFLLLSVWTTLHLTEPLLNWALGFYLLFGVVHSVFPVWLARQRPGASPGWWAHLFPPVALVLVMLPILKFESVSLLVWPVILLIDALAIGLAMLTASVLSLVAVLLLTFAATGLWLLRVPILAVGLPEELTVIGFFALFFFIIGIIATKKIMAKLAAPSTGAEGKPSSPFSAQLPPELLTQVPALSAILPFLLLTMMVLKLKLANPSPVFGLAALMVALLFGLVRTNGVDVLAAIGLACTLMLEHAWHFNTFSPDSPFVALGWYAGFGLVFFAFPFVFQRQFAGRVMPWTVAALALPAHFYLVYRGFKDAFPKFDMPGLVPAVFVLPGFAALVHLVRSIEVNHPKRNTLLALFGGTALFFVTLIFPIQFDKQWITLGWALEGAALLWLFHRVPHSGLRITGVALLIVSFARLALNPAVFDYHARTQTPIFNWYFYAYGVTTLCLWAGARLLAPPRNVVLGRNTPPALYSLGAMLAFLLLNIEIADYFSEGASLTFKFGGNFARDMTYSLAWALYALALLGVGVKSRSAGARYSGLGLLIVTIAKLFLHDLWALGGLYRIGALIGLAVVLILVSVIYQRFVAPLTKEEKPAEGTSSPTADNAISPEPKSP